MLLNSWRTRVADGTGELEIWIQILFLTEHGTLCISGMIIGLIVKYAGGEPTQNGARVSLKNLTSTPKNLWVSVENVGNFSYQLKGVLHTIKKAGNDLEQLVGQVFSLLQN